jgi:hypothetical protein
MKQKIWSVSLAALVAAGALIVSTPSAARAESTKEKMLRLGTYAGAAATAYGLARNKDTIAAAGAAGTYFAYRGWKGEINDRHDRWGRGRYDRDSRDRGRGRNDDYRRGRYDDYRSDYNGRGDYGRGDYGRGDYGRGDYGRDYRGSYGRDGRSR